MKRSTWCDVCEVDEPKLTPEIEIRHLQGIVKFRKESGDTAGASRLARKVRQLRKEYGL